ncbi:glycosyl hydrolase 115 family protein [Novosphingobium sp. SG707]|uniref:glycosyl hydrolase 115 family protein n=1 Tax=Novosphingobium sp. SG707 TaxID=2586996 RepID=UPI0014461CBD|nr:glycosyl hydrolase 115 family protein [Novosphingobium sp. SG707]NKI98183.1 hypothetical protein [Novosphingobium sp. SG707]
MKFAKTALLAAALCATSLSGHAYAGDDGIIRFAPTKDAFALADHGRIAPIIVAPGEAMAVRHAAQDLARDMAQVTGQTPRLLSEAAPAPAAIIIGTLGQSPIIDAMVKKGTINPAALAGKWESFLILSVKNPLPGVAHALVVVGSYRRGTAFGAYEVSRAMGVNPWSWWADLAPRHHDALYAAPGLHHFGPPSVRYRGIFVNDEDWGLFPWAAQSFDPEYKNIGPKTYARIFELMLRLKANTLWPAMHKTTAAFNSDPANAKLADDYGIIMGSSHSEVMLRNNVGEWKDAPEAFNYAANPEKIRLYWEERVQKNGAYENLWTIGMRGLHDTGMVGTSTMAEKVALLDRVIKDQRALLDKHVAGGAEKAGQIFVPYKEVLDIYRSGLKVPENVSIVWPDDNFGYIRQFPSKAEAHRSGGAGVYYHLSYLGYPLSYLWLSTTPPALVREEMTRAYDKGARNIWIVNVGDIKPAEIGTTHFLDMAWDVEKHRDESQRDYLKSWLGEAFGPELGAGAAALMDDYFLLNFARRPEHLEWPAKAEDRHLSDFSVPEAHDRLRRWRTLAAQAKAMAAQVPADRQDAWFELVEFPIRAASAANIRYFAAEYYDEMIEVTPAEAYSAGGAMAWADEEITAITERYNNGIAGGKWRNIMPAEPADPQWRIYRPRPLVTPAASLRSAPDRFFARVDATTAPSSPVLEAEDVPAKGWRKVEGMGRGRGVMIADAQGAPWSAGFTLAQGQTGVALGILPMFPDGDVRELKLEVSIDGGAPIAITVPRQVGSAGWVEGVLSNQLKVAVPAALTPGAHRIAVTARSGGIALDRLIFTAAP